VLVQVERTGTQTRFAQIVALMDEASSTKPQIAQLADRMARPFLIAVLLAAGAAALFWWPRDPGHALMVAVAVLVVTCPCALSLATPAAMLASAAHWRAVACWCAGCRRWRPLASVDTVVFDKTGTLTRDAFALARVTTRGGVSQADALAWAGALARQSLHPVSRALVAAGGQAATAPMHAEAVQEVAGQGLHGRVVMGGASGSGGQTFRLGSATFCGLARPAADALEVCLADEDGWVATFELREDLRADARSTVRWMAEQGIAVRLLSGDGATAVQRVATQVAYPRRRAPAPPRTSWFLREAAGAGRIRWPWWAMA
jgi:Cu2+-exporting ATPase